MVIDVYAFPGFIKEICQDPERVEFRRQQYFLYKQHVWPMELFIKQLNAAGIDKCIISAEDVTTRAGDTIVSNEEVRTLVDLQPERLIGFASVDPQRPDAVEVLEKAFKDLHLAGLKLSPAMQHFSPNDFSLMDSIYQICLKYNKPILFQSGMTWVKDSPSTYSRPVLLADSKINRFFCQKGKDLLTLFFLLFPECVNLPVHALDAGDFFIAQAAQFFHTTFNVQMGEYWIDRMLADKVMFGSTYPRIEQKRMMGAVDVLNLRPKQKAMVLGGNALRFLGLEEKENG